VANARCESKGGGKNADSTSMTFAKAIRGSILLFLVALLLALNVHFDSRAMDMSLVPRLQALYVVLGFGILIAAASGASRAGDFRLLGDPLVLAFGAYVLACGLSLGVAHTPAAGLLDFFRVGGTFLTLCLLCVLLPGLPEGRAWLLRVAACAGLVGAAIGAIQIVTRLGVRIPTRAELNQAGVEGFMSNINAYATFLLLLLPLCLCGAALQRGAWRGMAIAATLAVAGMILMVQSRAVYLAVGAGMTAAILLAAIRGAVLGVNKKLIWGFVVLLGACVSIVLLGVFFPVWSENPYLGRLAGLNPFNPDSSTQGRMLIWGIAWRMILDHPLLGVGAGNFTIRLDDYLGRNHEAIVAVGTNWTQPHNDFLWVLAEKGLLGLIPFLSVFLLAAWKVWTLSKSGDRATSWMAVFLGMGLVAYLVNSLFDSPLDRINLQVYVACYLALMVLGSNTSESRNAVKPRGEGLCKARLVAPAIGLLLVAGGCLYSHAALNQEIHAKTAREKYNQRKWVETLAEARLASSPWRPLDPMGTPPAFFEAMALMHLGALNQAIERMEFARTLIPKRYHILNNLGLLYYENGDYPKAIEIFSLAIKTHPSNYVTLEHLANCHLQLGDSAAALAALERIPEEARRESAKNQREAILSGMQP
jgi:O-antigen ligase